MSFFTEAPESVLTGNYSQPFGLGFECELIQRAAKAQVIKYITNLTDQLQNIWNERDKEFAETFNLAYKPIVIPEVKTENIRAGIESFSQLEAPLERWPAVLIYARNAAPYSIQEDQFDTSSVNLCIEIMCTEGPVNNAEVHSKEGMGMMEALDSQIQRLSDVVYLCIQKDKTLCGSVGQIEKPPIVTTSLPMTRKETTTVTGETYIFQGKQFEFVVQKITL